MTSVMCHMTSVADVIWQKSCSRCHRCVIWCHMTSVMCHMTSQKFRVSYAPQKFRVSYDICTTEIQSLIWHLISVIWHLLQMSYDTWQMSYAARSPAWDVIWHHMTHLKIYNVLRCLKTLNFWSVHHMTQMSYDRCHMVDTSEIQSLETSQYIIDLKMYWNVIRNKVQ